MINGLIIPADPSRPVERRSFAGLDDYQKAVRGWIEGVDVPSLGITLFVNESGIFLELPFNPRATFMWWYEWPRARRGSMLLGDAVVVGMPDADGNATDVPERTQQLLLTPSPYAVIIDKDGHPLGGHHPFLYDDYFEAVVWAMILADQLLVDEHVRVVAVEKNSLDDGDRGEDGDPKISH